MGSREAGRLVTAFERSYAAAVDLAQDLAVRSAAMAYVERLAMRFGRYAIPRRVIAVGFGFRGSTVKLIGPQGIFKPSILDLPLTITTAPSNPYGDLVQDDYLVYRYFQTDPNHRDNNGLRKAMEARHQPMTAA